MKRWRKYTSLLLMLLSLTLLAGCGSSGKKWSDTDEIDDYGTVTRNGEHTIVCVCHDQKTIYLYYNDEEHKLFDTAMLPMDEINDEDWSLNRISFRDFTGDNNSDLQVYLYHSDMTESQIWWAWVEGKGYVYQPDDSQFYHSIVVRDPDDYDTAYDYDMYKGIWFSDSDSQSNDTYIEFDWDGYWKYYVAGEIVDEGSLRYEPEGDYVYVDSVQDSAIDGAQVELEGDRLYVTNLGSFTSLVSGNDSENSAFDGNSELHQRAVSEFEGTWYYDNDSSAETYIIFDADGNWSYYQRASGDAEGTEMDCGIICYSVDEVSTYYAESVMYDDTSYRVYDLDKDILVWNDEYTYCRMK